MWLILLLKYFKTFFQWNFLFHHGQYSWESILISLLTINSLFIIFIILPVFFIPFYWLYHRTHSSIRVLHSRIQLSRGNALLLKQVYIPFLQFSIRNRSSRRRYYRLPSTSWQIHEASPQCSSDLRNIGSQRPVFDVSKNTHSVLPNHRRTRYSNCLKQVFHQPFD